MRAFRNVAGLPLWEDPATPHSTLIDLIDTEPRVLMNPNMPPEQLERFAPRYPEIVELNPVLPLLFLEHPEMLKSIKEAMRRGWIGEEGPFHRLPAKEKRLVAVEMAERVLDLAEEETIPRSMKRAEEALRLAREVASGFWYRTGMMNDVSKGVYQTAQFLGQTGEEHEPERFAFLAIAAASDQNLNRFDDRTYRIVYDSVEATPGLVQKAVRKEGELNRGWAAGEAAEQEEIDVQVEMVRAAVTAVREAEEKRAKRHYKLKVKPAPNLDSGEQRDIRRGIQHAKDSANQIANLMRSDTPDTWPDWLGVGLIAGGVLAAVLVGPELLAAAGLAEGAAGLSAVADEAAAVIIDTAEAGNLNYVSVQGFIEGAEVAGSEEAGELLNLLIQRLEAASLSVVDAPAEVIAEVGVKFIP